VDEMLKHAEVIDVTDEEMQEAKDSLKEDNVKEDQQLYLVSEQQLKKVAKKLGREETQVPYVDGVCINDAGEKYSCKPFTGQRLNTVSVGGIADCPDKVGRAISDLQVKVLKRVQSGRSTDNEYYDRFLAFLAGEFTEGDKVKYMPSVYEGPSEVKGAIASYTPGPGYVMVSHSFCKLRPGLRRKLIGHEFFHHWDNGLDGNPMLPGETAEDAAYSVMKYL
jgi:hypothetical protein